MHTSAQADLMSIAKTPNLQRLNRDLLKIPLGTPRFDSTIIFLVVFSDTTSRLDGYQASDVVRSRPYSVFRSLSLKLASKISSEFVSEQSSELSNHGLSEPRSQLRVKYKLSSQVKDRVTREVS